MSSVMTPSVSAHYRKLTPEQAAVLADVYSDSWKDPQIPTIQFEQVVKKDLEDYRNHKPHVAFDALRTLLLDIPQLNNPETRLLDVGASSGYYSEVLKIIGFQCRYTGLDFSIYFKELANRVFPEIPFEVGLATDLPFDDNSQDIVLHGACIMHVWNHRKAIQEAARVAKRYVIFHRTPVYVDDTPTEYFSKDAYGVTCLEMHYNERSILRTFENCGLRLKNHTLVFSDGYFVHRSYLLEKTQLAHHPV